MVEQRWVVSILDKHGLTEFFGFYFKVWEGLNVVKTGRVMLGETNPADSKPGTIRGDFCIQVGRCVLSLLIDTKNSTTPTRCLTANTKTVGSLLF